MSLRDNLRRNPVLWLVIGLPLFAIVVFASLAVFSSRLGGIDASPDEVQRTGRLQQTDMGPDHRAKELNLSAILREHEGELFLHRMTGAFPNEPLNVELRHPMQAAQDIRTTLQPQSDGLWQVAQDVDFSHDWNVVLTPADGSWRLFGRLIHDQHAVRLAHAFERDTGERLDAVRGVNSQ